MGEQATLAVVAVEVTKRGACTLAIGAVAALAGVSESTVKRALQQARALGLVTVQERRLSRFRSDTNIVRIVAREWTSWLELWRSAVGFKADPARIPDTLGKAVSGQWDRREGLPRGRVELGQRISENRQQVRHKGI